jgi:hypothetical protein
MLDEKLQPPQRFSLFPSALLACTGKSTRWKFIQFLPKDTADHNIRGIGIFKPPLTRPAASTLAYLEGQCHEIFLSFFIKRFLLVPLDTPRRISSIRSRDSPPVYSPPWSPDSPVYSSPWSRDSLVMNTLWSPP